MRLQVSIGTFKQSDFITGCGWAGSELYTCGDDKKVHKINAEGDSGDAVINELESFPTDFHWLPSGHYLSSFGCFAGRNALFGTGLLGPTPL